MENRNDDEKTAYFELGDEQETLSVDATQQDVDEFIEKVEKHAEISHCVEAKLNPALKILFKKYPDLEKVVTANACALNAATC